MQWGISGSVCAMVDISKAHDWKEVNDEFCGGSTGGSQVVCSDRSRNLDALREGYDVNLL